MKHIRREPRQAFRALSFGAILLCAACLEEDPTKPVIRFTDATATAGLDDFRYASDASEERWLPETMAPGVAFIDANQDDWPDILVIGGGSVDPQASAQSAAVRLYLNDGNGKFHFAQDQTGLASLRAYGFGICAADHDNDGDTDAVLSTLDGAYLLDNVDGIYQPRRLALGDNPGWTSAAAFLDADNDGRLDLFLGRYVDWSPANDLFCSNDGAAKSYCTPEAYRGLPPLLLQNSVSGFVENSEAAGLAGLPGKSLGATLLDFNGDGWTDLFVANDTERDLLLQNLGDGRFAEVGRNLGVAYDEAGKTRAGMGVATGYLDETGQPSLLVTNFAREMIGVYRYDGSRVFADRALTSGIGAASVPTLGFGLALADFDLDGDLDLFVGNGHVHLSGLPDGTKVEQPPHLFINDGTGKFSDVVAAGGTGLSEPMLARGVAQADYDRDGDIDILVADNRGPLRLWRNDTNTSNAALRINLQGNVSNRDGIGARLSVRANGRTMKHVVTSCGSYQSSSELGVTFGLPTGSHADIEIAWPGGSVEEIKGVSAGQEILIFEGSDNFLVLENGN